MSNCGGQSMSASNMALLNKERGDESILALAPINYAMDKARLANAILTPRAMDGYVDISDAITVHHSPYIAPDLTRRENFAPSALPLLRQAQLRARARAPTSSPSPSAMLDVENDGDLDIYWAGALARGNDGFIGDWTNSPGRLLVNDTPAAARGKPEKIELTDRTLEYRLLDITDMDYEHNPPRRKTPGHQLAQARLHLPRGHGLVRRGGRGGVAAEPHPRPVLHARGGQRHRHRRPQRRRLRRPGGHALRRLQLAVAEDGEPEGRRRRHGAGHPRAQQGHEATDGVRGRADLRVHQPERGAGGEPLGQAAPVATTHALNRFAIGARITAYGPTVSATRVVRAGGCAGLGELDRRHRRARAATARSRRSTSSGRARSARRSTTRCRWCATSSSASSARAASCRAPGARQRLRDRRRDVAAVVGDDALRAAPAPARGSCRRRRRRRRRRWLAACRSSRVAAAALVDEAPARPRSLVPLPPTRMRGAVAVDGDAGEPGRCRSATGSAERAPACRRRSAAPPRCRGRRRRRRRWARCRRR